jgi:hypothetical protein
MILLSKNFQIIKPMYCCFDKDGDILIASDLAMQQMEKLIPADFEDRNTKIWNLAVYYYRPNIQIFVLQWRGGDFEIYEYFRGQATIMPRQDFIFRQPRTPLCPEQKILCSSAGTEFCKHQCLEDLNLKPLEGPIEQWFEPKQSVERDGGLVP